VSGLRPMLATIGLAMIAGLAASAAQAQGPVIEHHVAVLQGLDKVTARISPVRAPLGAPTTFGTLEIVARTCRETPPTEPPESAAFLEIRELPPASDPDGPRTELFSGWMFASSPAVSALEHPVYDVWVVDCEEPIEPRPDDLSADDPDHQGATESTPPASP
jgi:hypothetical protein